MRYKKDMSTKTIFFTFLFLKFEKISLFQNYVIKTCKDKNNYYHSFKTPLEGRSRAKPLGWGSGKGGLIWASVKVKVIIIIILKVDSGVDLG
jgi:hypothetical protein